MVSAMTIGDRIRAARTRLGLTQRVLAERLGVDKSAVAQWEGGGGGKGIKTSNLVEAARVLQIKPSELLGEGAGADSNSVDKMEILDPKEIALVSLYRRLPARLKDVHLQLLYAQTGTSQPPEEQANPGNRKRISR